MRRLLVLSLALGATSAAAVFVVGTPAAGHEEISPVSVAVGRPAFLTVTAANERSAELTEIAVLAPEGVRFGPATRQPPGWTAQVSAGEVSWGGGSVAPRTFEQWGFEVEPVDQPGPLRLRVRSSYAGGATDTHEVEVTAVPGGDNPVVSTQPPASQPGPTTTGAAPTIPAARATSGEATAATALVFSIVAGIAAAAALIVAVRRNPAPANRPPANTGEDW